MGERLRIFSGREEVWAETVAHGWPSNWPKELQEQREGDVIAHADLTEEEAKPRYDYWTSDQLVQQELQKSLGCDGCEHEVACKAVENNVGIKQYGNEKSAYANLTKLAEDCERHPEFEDVA